MCYDTSASTLVQFESSTMLSIIHIKIELRDKTFPIGTIDNHIVEAPLVELTVISSVRFAK